MALELTGAGTQGDPFVVANPRDVVAEDVAAYFQRGRTFYFQFFAPVVGDWRVSVDVMWSGSLFWQFRVAGSGSGFQRDDAAQTVTTVAPGEAVTFSIAFTGVFGGGQFQGATLTITGPADPEPEPEPDPEPGPVPAPRPARVVAGGLRVTLGGWVVEPEQGLRVTESEESWARLEFRLHAPQVLAGPDYLVGVAHGGRCVAFAGRTIVITGHRDVWGTFFGRALVGIAGCRLALNGVCIVASERSGREVAIGEPVVVDHGVTFDGVVSEVPTTRIERGVLFVAFEAASREWLASALIARRDGPAPAEVGSRSEALALAAARIGLSVVEDAAGAPDALAEPLEYGVPLATWLLALAGDERGWRIEGHRLLVAVERPEAAVYSLGRVEVSSIGGVEDARGLTVAVVEGLASFATAGAGLPERRVAVPDGVEPAAHAAAVHVPRDVQLRRVVFEVPPARRKLQIGDRVRVLAALLGGGRELRVAYLVSEWHSGAWWQTVTGVDVAAVDKRLATWRGLDG